MVIVFMKNQGTLKITDKNGNSIHKNGDDKILCPNETAAHVAVDLISAYTGNMFFMEEEKDLLIWRALL